MNLNEQPCLLIFAFFIDIIHYKPAKIVIRTYDSCIGFLLVQTSHYFGLTWLVSSISSLFLAWFPIFFNRFPFLLKFLKKLCRYDDSPISSNYFVVINEIMIVFGYLKYTCCLIQPFYTNIKTAHISKSRCCPRISFIDNIFYKIRSTT